MTGADWPEEYDLLRQGLRTLEICPPEARVVNDSMIAMRGGTSRPYGVILIAGTGGNCAVKSPSGEEFIYHYFHDPELQGGGALAARSLTTIFRAHTGRESDTLLTRLALAHFQLGSVDELCRRYYAGELDRVTELAPAVFEAANQGDIPAEAILRAFGEGYAGLAVAAMRRMNMLDLDVEVVLSGSIFKGRGSLLIDTIAEGIHSAAPKARLVNARFEPVVGAVLLGLEAQGLVVTDEAWSHLERSASELHLIRRFS
jgi:N-acetylglucosamine kinase-like BadF-type ATPase